MGNGKGFFLPLRDLLRERAVHAIRGVPQAEIFVDLEQPLLERRRLEKCRPARAVSKEPLRGHFHALVGQGRAQVFEPDPATRTAYDELYSHFRHLYFELGRGTTGVLPSLRRIAAQARL